MGLFHRKKTENRSDAGEIAEASLLRAMLFGSGVTKEMALQVPTVSGGIDMIAGLVAGTPVKLYRETSGKAQEVKDDPRVRLLNDETGDTLDANQFWRAMVRDYYTGKGGYAYIHRERRKFKSIHYVDEAQISIQKNTDPIFKDFSIMVDGRSYRPYQFLKVLRNSRDGATGVPLTVESSKLIEVAYQTLCFEAYLVKKGGNKKGFLKSEKALTTEAMAALKEAYSNLYSNSSDNVVVLNRGIDFQESSATSVEMQLNENKVTNAEEFAKIFHISTATIGGQAADTDGLAKLAAIPLMVAIQCALNRDFLLEKEKGKLYWAFDTKELLKGDMKDRFEAYRTALEANFMQPDEVRFAEDMEPLGLNWIRLGLNDVLYDPKTKQIYTPNTNQTAIMGEIMPEEEKAPESEEKGLPSGAKDDTMEAEKPEEARANPYHDPKNGRFTTGGGQGKVRLGEKELKRLSSAILTDHPWYKAGERHNKCWRNHFYQFIVNGPGDYTVMRKIKIVGNEEKIGKLMHQKE
ncbi:MAG: phage portal protein [Firmicutes bacterium]|nr:phage portal protein [Bacillota bacterium]